MHTPEQRSTGLKHSLLPVWAAGGALLVYLLSLNHWVSVTSLAVLSDGGGWGWTPPVQAPLLHVLTLPFRLLPAAWQPAALNIFSAVCAALALGLLARSVILLPQDRTHDQRRLEGSEHSLLSVPGAWVPPVLAMLVCGLQYTMWEHATAITGETLDLLVFAYVIRCLLEYRLDGRERWLARLALVYGLGVTNNWAMIGFFPGFLAALAWIMGRDFFNGRFILRMTALGGAGLLLYLLLPLTGWLADDSPYTFWQLLRTNLGNQKSILLSFPKSTVALCGLTSLLPVLVMGIRWPSSAGETSSAGVALTDLMFRVVHALFFVACILAAFDHKFSPRQIGGGLPFLTFYYLGALSVGYYSGYFLLVFGKKDERPWIRRSDFRKFLVRALAATVWLALVLVPTGLVYRNLPAIRANNGPVLKEFAAAQTAPLPADGAVLVSDDAFNLSLVEAALRREGKAGAFVFLNTRFLPFNVYHRALARRYPALWGGLTNQFKLTDPIDLFTLVQLMNRLARSNTVYYLEPSFGYYFENLHLEPHGLVYRFVPYPIPPSGTIAQPPLAPPLLEENRAVWQQLEPHLAEVNRLAAKNIPTALVVGRHYSRALDYWGVELQKNGSLPEAARAFSRALQLNPENRSARINQEFNQALQAGRPITLKPGESLDEKLGRFRSWDALLGINGPVDDPDCCYRLGLVFAQNLQYRQAVNQLLRVHQFDPDNLDVRLLLINAYLQGQWPDPALTLIAETRARQDGHPLGITNQTELIRLEAWANFRKQDVSAAEQLLKRAVSRYPQDVGMLETLAQIYLLSGQYTNALTTLDQQLQLAPDNVRALQNKGAIHIQLKSYLLAIEPLDHVLKLQPDNRPALMNRAIAHLQSGHLDAAQQDYEALRVVMPNFFSVYYGLGEIAWRRTNTPAALANYELYLRYAPAAGEETALVRTRIKELNTKSPGK